MERKQIDVIEILVVLLTAIICPVFIPFVIRVIEEVDDEAD